jgi:hypothetical protein
VIASNTIKYYGVNLTKETKALFNENYKSLNRENEEGIKRWKVLPFSWIVRINHMKMAIRTKQSTCSIQFLSKFH